MRIESLVKQEVKKIDPKAEVILFGSRARGDSRNDSDWDFLILLERPLTQDLKFLILDSLYDLELEYNSVISPIIHSRKEWEDLAVTPIYQAIKKEGKRP
ncbi:MAG: nucleotidyltransferase domain-containing protein [Saprospiraceae bacterium]|nr:nucleotidyltransferase domain-containing protein [Saprospiraceae bacterium]MCB0575110.1 nucleotidyltransferase domain-containing protein [Saprospiraceae bacterium]MCB9305094.1 nucleotidyltransferase domain-containing protein [Lewinellaceae bacterium]MCB9353373.1 nucleotidyltransferase domain-containing protein [Lewinellaceae bacterium]